VRNGRSLRWLSVALVATVALPSLAEAGSRRRTFRGAAPVGNSAISALRSDDAVLAALAAAPAGGTVRLPLGAFRAAIVIDRPLTVLADPRGTTLDAAGLGRPAITILAGVPDVTIDGVRLVAADRDGLVAGAGCDRLRVLRSTVERCAGDGLHVDLSTGVRVEACVFDRNGGDGLDLTAIDATVVACTFRANGGAAARLAGRDVALTDGTSQGGAEGIAFAGLRCSASRVGFRATKLVARFLPTSDTCVLARCDVRDADALAVTEEGSTYDRIATNRVASTTTDAVVLRGTWHTVEDNVLGRVRGTAVVGDGLSLRVADNTVAGADATGVRLTGMGNTVEGNTLGPCGDDAVVVEGVANVVAHNTCRDGRGGGVVVDGTLTQVLSNRVAGVAGAGIVLSGDDCTLQDNRLERAGLEGIVVAAGRDNRLLSNAIQRCGGRGLADAGTGTVLERNRID
jgi:hypothetical protein